MQKIAMTNRREPTAGAAILDRIAHNAYRLELDLRAEDNGCRSKYFCQRNAASGHQRMDIDVVLGFDPLDYHLGFGPCQIDQRSDRQRRIFYQIRRFDLAEVEAAKE